MSFSSYYDFVFGGALRDEFTIFIRIVFFFHTQTVFDFSLMACASDHGLV